MTSVVRNTETFWNVKTKLSSLKHKKDEVGSIAPGQECGVRLESDSVRFEANDDIIFYEMKKAVRNIEWDPGF